MTKIGASRVTRWSDGKFGTPKSGNTEAICGCAPPVIGWKRITRGLKMALLRTPADHAFSQCVRERANWTCERCGKAHETNSKGLHCSHGIGRGTWATRFEPLNAISACWGCHRLEGGNWQYRMLTNWELERLQELANDIPLGKIYRKTRGKGDIAKHFRTELARMREQRMAGVQGRIEFEAWY